MTDPGTWTVQPIGVVRSTLRTREEAPRQGHKGAPEAWLEISPAYAPALEGLVPGMELVVLTWFHQSRRDLLKVHPRRDPANPLTGVFATRSPDRPNPIGLHRVTLLEMQRTRLRVYPLEAIDGTPVVDVKPALAGVEDA